MIVRDEAIIERCLGSVADHISYWVVCDTGSSDATAEFVEQYFSERAIPGELHHDRWENFGCNRNELLRRARGKSDYLLVVDADMTMQFTGQRYYCLDGYLVPVRTRETLSFELRLLRADLPWTYSGTTREFAYVPDQNLNIEKTNGLAVVHHADGVSRVEKYQRDLKLLEREEVAYPNYRHAQFFLAETHAALLVAAPEQATYHFEQATHYYQRRIEMGGDSEEVFYARYKRALVRLSYEGFSWEAMDCLMEAYRSRPQRIEPLYEYV